MRTIRIIANSAALLLLYVLIVQSTAITRFTSPVNWKWHSSEEKGQPVLHFTAEMQKNWHIYSQHLKEGGPIPTSFHFTASEYYTLDGETTEPKSITYFDKNFEMEVKYFDHQAIFSQKIKRKTNQEFYVEGYLTFMCCDDSKCLPPEDITFKILISAIK